jgi:hypothetical protein
MKKILILICFICVFALLVACNRDETLDTTTLEKVPDLVVNPELDGLVTLQVQIESNMLIERIENHTDFLVELDFPKIEYFDGENWLTIPRDFEFASISESIESGELFESQFNLDDYQMPRKGQFRFRRRIFPDLYPSRTRDYHDLVVEFSID